ncbi:MAG: C4-type zinc ribbon domain-containing protein [Dehalococcoidia bacterium]|nr:C4-type zinc ribbon domain-containing protein [Dehalococcoidia bacterium]
MTRISNLFDLQDIDLEIDSRRVAISEAESRLGESEEVETAAGVTIEREAEVQELHKKLKAAEWEVEDLTNKIKPLEKKLYGGSVHIPKELASIEEDIRFIQARKRVLEDKELDVMSQLEEAERALAAAKHEHATLLTEWEEEQRRLNQERENLTAEIAQLEDKRAAQRSRIDGEALALYDALRATHQGRAVAKVERGTCGGCRISLPMSLLQRARGRSDVVVQCSSCERILYVS